MSEIEPFSGIELAKIAIQLQRLKAYEESEKQGLLIKLPCKIGTTVYVVRTLWRNTAYDGETVEEEKFSYDMLPKFGDTVFLNEDEAYRSISS